MKVKGTWLTSYGYGSSACMDFKVQLFQLSTPYILGIVNYTQKCEAQRVAYQGDSDNHTTCWTEGCLMCWTLYMNSLRFILDTTHTDTECTFWMSGLGSSNSKGHCGDFINIAVVWRWFKNYMVDHTTPVFVIYRLVLHLQEMKYPRVPWSTFVLHTSVAVNVVYKISRLQLSIAAPSKSSQQLYGD